MIRLYVLDAEDKKCYFRSGARTRNELKGQMNNSNAIMLNDKHYHINDTFAEPSSTDTLTIINAIIGGILGMTTCHFLGVLVGGCIGALIAEGQHAAEKDQAKLFNETKV